MLIEQLAHSPHRFRYAFVNFPRRGLDPEKLFSAMPTNPLGCITANLLREIAIKLAHHMRNALPFSLRSNALNLPSTEHHHPKVSEEFLL